MLKNSVVDQCLSQPYFAPAKNKPTMRRRIPTRLINVNCSLRKKNDNASKVTNARFCTKGNPKLTGSLWRTSAYTGKLPTRKRMPNRSIGEVNILPSVSRLSVWGISFDESLIKRFPTAPLAMAIKARKKVCISLKMSCYFLRPPGIEPGYLT